MQQGDTAVAVVVTKTVIPDLDQAVAADILEEPAAVFAPRIASEAEEPVDRSTPGFSLKELPVLEKGME